MKKHPILYTFLFFVILFILFNLLLIRDIYRVFKFVEKSDLSREERLTSIGIKGLCLHKKIEYDETKESVETNINKLLEKRPLFIDYFISLRGFNFFKLKDFPYLKLSKRIDELEVSDYQEEESNTKKFNDLKADIKLFDDCFKIDSVKDYDWSVFDYSDKESKNPYDLSYVVNSDDLNKLCTLIGLTEAYSKKDSESVDSSVLFGALLKLHLLNVYVNKGALAYWNTNLDLETIYVFYDNIIKDKYSKKEMENMLAVLKQAIPLIPNYADSIEYTYRFTKKLYDYSYSEFPFLTYTLSLFTDDSITSLDNIYNKFKEGKYKEGSDIASNQSLSLIVSSPEFANFYDHYKLFIATKSRLALMQAIIEDKLGLTVTAKDPFDNEPIRSYTNKDGKVIYYCLGVEGKDNKGTLENIVNCDTDFKSRIKLSEK